MVSTSDLLVLAAAAGLAGCSASIFINEDGLGREAVDPGVCGFENGDLAGFGHPGEASFEPEEGGKVAIVEEGGDWSALEGEEDLWFHGRRAVMIRSNDDGDRLTVGVITTDAFVPRGSVFVVDQLSEVGGEGIDLELRVVDAASGDVLETFDVPVHTGGYIPELGPQHSEIPGFPEITLLGGAAGEFVRETFDLTAYGDADRRIRVQLRQHTTVDDNGFFTVLDNLCDGFPADPEDGV
jgi:hypothetical protein